MLVPAAQVLQLEGFPEKDLSDLGLWDRYGCPGVFCALHAPGKSLGFLEWVRRWWEGGDGQEQGSSRDRATKGLATKKLLQAKSCPLLR